MRINLKSMQNLSDVFIEKFKDAATELVRNEVTDTDEENLKTIIMFTARDMAIGAKLKQNENIAIGIGIGIGITFISFGIANKVLGKHKDIVIYDMDTNEVQIKKGNVEEAFEEVSVSQSEVTDREIKSEDEENKSGIVDRINDILKKPQNLEDLKAVIKELKDNEKK